MTHAMTQANADRVLQLLEQGRVKFAIEAGTGDLLVIEVRRADWLPAVPLQCQCGATLGEVLGAGAVLLLGNVHATEPIAIRCNSCERRRFWKPAARVDIAANVAYTVND